MSLLRTPAASLRPCRAPAARPPPLAPRRAAPAPRRAVRLAPPRAGAGAGGDDPYEVLGLRPGANPDAINRAYNILKREKRGDEAALARVEAAHGSLMMAQLTARMRGGVKAADPSIAYADRGTFFPWRPRRADADRMTMIYAGAIQAGLVASAFLSPTAGTQPVVASAVVGAIANILKLNKIFPPSNSEDASPAARSRGAKNMGRGLLLAVMATFVGCALVFTLPDTVAGVVGLTLPPAFYEGEKLLLAVGSAAANWAMTAFFR